MGNTHFFNKDRKNHRRGSFMILKGDGLEDVFVVEDF